LYTPRLAFGVAIRHREEFAMSMGRGHAAALGIGIAVMALAGASHGAVVYDAITGNERRFTFFSTDEYAQDLFLTTGAGTTIRQVEVGVSRNPAFPGAYSGLMTVRLWADAGGAPGALLGVATAPVMVEDNLVHIFAASFGPTGVVSPTAAVWTGVQFSYATQLGAGLVYGRQDPVVGQWGRSDARHYPDGTWSVLSDRNDPAYIRIDTVPTPGALAAVVVGGLMATRRRRRIEGAGCRRGAGIAGRASSTALGVP
jgi:MYXO-CTERM domain-containing protein